MKKRIILSTFCLIIVILILHIVSYFKYNVNYIETNNFSNNDIYIENKIETNQKQMNCKNIKFNSVFQKYDLEENDNKCIFKLNNDQEKNSSLTVYITLPIIDIIKNSSKKIEYISDINNKSHENKLTNNEVNRILKDYKCQTDIDLLKAYMKYKDDKVTFLMTKKNMQRVYFFKTLYVEFLPTFDSITFFSGIYNGYIFSFSKNVNYVNLLLNDNRYVFMFIGEEFSYDYILEFIRTIKIN